MRTAFILLCVFALVSLSSGCSTKLFNGGYDEDFTECPYSSDGGCKSVEDAHSDAVQSAKNKERASIHKYSAGEYDGAFDDAYGQKPLSILLEELQKCVEKKDKDCIRTKKEAIEFHNKYAEERVNASRQYKAELREEELKFSAFQQESYGENRPRPVRSNDKMMELTMLPYETDSGALASSRTFWFVVESGQWSWGNPTRSKSFKSQLGGIQ